MNTVNQTLQSIEEKGRLKFLVDTGKTQEVKREN